MCVCVCVCVCVSLPVVLAAEWRSVSTLLGKNQLSEPLIAQASKIGTRLLSTR